jgi:nucleoside-diphosphate-sugar epimerase
VSNDQSNEALGLHDEYAGKSVLVTGGASFIGSHLAEELVSCGASVIIADDLSSGRVENLSSIAGEVHLEIFNARDTSRLLSVATGCDTAFHLAATHGGRGYIDTHPVECVSNMALDYDVFSTLARADVAKIIHASSACAYPTNLQDSATELGLLSESQANFSDPGRAFPDGEYGWGKLMGELQIQAIQKQYGIHTIAARIFTAYGERENLSHAAIALLAKGMLHLDPYPIWGDGSQTRNFTYVKDTVRGLLIAGRFADRVDALNVGTSQHVTVNELVEAIFELLQWRPKEIDYQIDMPVGVKSRAADNSLILELSGWEPSTSVQNGISATHTYLETLGDMITVDALNAGLMTR